MELAGIASRIGGLAGASADIPPPAEGAPSEVVAGLDRLVAMAGPGFATVDELRRSLDGIVGQMTASSVARGEELGRSVEAASARFEALMVEIDQRQQHHLIEITEQRGDRLNEMSQLLDVVQSRLDHLTGIAEPLSGELERLLYGQGQVIAASASGAASAVEAVDERLRRAGDQSTAEILGRLDRLAERTGPGFDTVDELRRSWDKLVAQATASNTERQEELGRAVETAAARFGEMLTATSPSRTNELLPAIEAAGSRMEALLTSANATLADDLVPVVEAAAARFGELLTASNATRGEELTRAIDTAAARFSDQLSASNAARGQEMTPAIETVAERFEELLAASNMARRDEVLPAIEAVAARVDQQLTAANIDRGEELSRAIDMAATRFETLMADRDQMHQQHLIEAANRDEARLSRLSGGFELVSSQLDHLTAMAQPVATELERLGGMASDTAATNERQRQISEESVEEILGRLDRLASVTEPGVEMISQLRQSWNDIVGQLAQSGTAGGEDVGRAVEAASTRFEAMMVDLDQRHDRHLAEFSEQGESRLEGLFEGLDVVRSRLDNLTDLAQPMSAELERMREEQAQLLADAAALELRMRQIGEQATAQILGRLDRLAAVAGPGFETVDGLRESWDALAARVATLDGLAPALDRRIDEAAAELNLKVSGSTRVSLDRADALGRSVEAALARFEAVLADRDQRQDQDLAEFVRHSQEQLAGQVDVAVASIVETVSELKHQPQPPGAEVLERMSRLGTELEGASDRLRKTAQDIAQDRQDSRAQMATLDLGLKVALTGMESVAAGRQGEQLAQIKDAQREVAESVLQGLQRFGRQIDAGLQQATEELTTSVFLTHEDSDDRSHALQEDLTKALARVEDAELVRDHQLVDLQRVVERLGREVQLLRPAIDLRPGPNQGLLNDVALARFADRVATLLSEEVMARLEAATRHESPPALTPLSSQNGQEKD